MIYAVTSPRPGIMEVNYMWLPTWIGMNTNLLKTLSEAAGKAAVGLPLPEALQAGHVAVLDCLDEKYPELHGLRDYLESLRLVDINGGTQENNGQE